MDSDIEFFEDFEGDNSDIQYERMENINIPLSEVKFDNEFSKQMEVLSKVSKFLPKATEYNKNIQKLRRNQEFMEDLFEILQYESENFSEKMKICDRDIGLHAVLEYTGDRLKSSLENESMKKWREEMLISLEVFSVFSEIVLEFPVFSELIRLSILYILEVLEEVGMNSKDVRKDKTKKPTVVDIVFEKIYSTVFHAVAKVAEVNSILIFTGDKISPVEWEENQKYYKQVFMDFMNYLSEKGLFR